MVAWWSYKQDFVYGMVDFDEIARGILTPAKKRVEEVKPPQLVLKKDYRVGGSMRKYT